MKNYPVPMGQATADRTRCPQATPEQATWRRAILDQRLQGTTLSISAVQPVVEEYNWSHVVQQQNKLRAECASLHAHVSCRRPGVDIGNGECLSAGSRSDLGGSRTFMADSDFEGGDLKQAKTWGPVLCGLCIDIEFRTWLASFGLGTRGFGSSRP